MVSIDFERMDMSQKLKKNGMKTYHKNALSGILKISPLLFNIYFNFICWY